MKFCINCEHYTSLKHNTDDGYCGRPQLGINLVNGEKITKLCSLQRMDTSNSCGTGAYYFALKVVA